MSDLPFDAIAPMPPPPSIIPKDEVQFSYIPPTPTPSSTPRRRGRPPGSKNRLKDDVSMNSPMTMNTGNKGRPRQPSSNDPIDETRASKEEKKARAAQYSAYIVDELNDKLFMFIIGATAIPAEAIYKNGRVPPKAQTNPNLTEFGNSIAIPADVADSWGKLLAELTYTNAGKGLLKAGSNPGTGIAIAALTALFSSYRYFQQLKPTLEIIRKAQQQSQQPPQE